MPVLYEDAKHKVLAFQNMRGRARYTGEATTILVIDKTTGDMIPLDKAPSSCLSAINRLKDIGS